jgi:hypothetical protein
VIDNPVQTERLLAKLQSVLPLSAVMTPELATTLQVKNVANNFPPACSITGISYAGDEGGIVCRLGFAGESENPAFVSITHLRFHPRVPLAREIAAYQKHRVKRLRRQPS